MILQLNIIIVSRMGVPHCWYGYVTIGAVDTEGGCCKMEMERGPTGVDLAVFKWMCSNRQGWLNRIDVTK